MEYTTGTVTMQVISKGDTQPPFKNPNDVDFDVQYPKDFKGQKLMPEGVVTISKESAEQFSKMGIGKVVEPANAETETSKTEAVTEKKTKSK